MIAGKATIVLLCRRPTWLPMDEDVSVPSHTTRGTDVRSDEFHPARLLNRTSVRVGPEWFSCARGRASDGRVGNGGAGGPRATCRRKLCGRGVHCSTP